MSATASKEERRNLRRAIGDTAAAAMAECKAAVLDVRTSNLELAKILRRQEDRIAKLEEQVKAALKLGFDNEKAVGAERTHRLDLAREQRAYVDGLAHVTVGELRALSRRSLWGRLKWLLRGE